MALVDLKIFVSSSKNSASPVLHCAEGGKPKVYGRTVTGAKPVNQDRFLAAVDPATGFFSGWVADGISGRPEGEKASTQVIASIQAQIVEMHSGTLPQFPQVALWFKTAEEGMGRTNQGREEKDWSGATLSGVVGGMGDGMAYVGEVGDSRVYHFNPASGVISLINPDNSSADALIQREVAGKERVIRFPLRDSPGEEISPLRVYYERTRMSPLRTGLLGFIGAGRDKIFKVNGEGRAHFRRVAVDPGDRFFLCSDEISTFVFFSFAKILRTTAAFGIEQTVDLLVEARSSVPNDDATVVGIEV